MAASKHEAEARRAGRPHPIAHFEVVLGNDDEDEVEDEKGAKEDEQDEEDNADRRRRLLQQVPAAEGEDPG